MTKAKTDTGTPTVQEVPLSGDAAGYQRIADASINASFTPPSKFGPSPLDVFGGPAQRAEADEVAAAIEALHVADRTKDQHEFLARRAEAQRA